MAYCCYDSVRPGDRRYLNESRICSGPRRQIDGMAASSWSVIEKSGFSARTNIEHEVGRNESIARQANRVHPGVQAMLRLRCVAINGLWEDLMNEHICRETRRLHPHREMADATAARGSDHRCLRRGKLVTPLPNFSFAMLIINAPVTAGARRLER